MRVGNSSGPKLCLHCGRTKSRAIKEQCELKRLCDCDNCTFYDEILLELQKPKFKIGSTVIKKNFKIGKIK